MSQSLLTFTLLGNDAGAARAIERVGAAATLTSAKMATAASASEAAWAKARKTMNAVGKVSTVIAIGLGVEGVKAAVSFQQQMVRLNTQAGVTTQGVAELSKQVLNLAPQVGESPDQLAKALYHIESAFQSTGITGGKALEILKTASEGAKIGGSDLVDTTNALDAAIVSGIPGVQNFQQAMGALNKIVGTGDMTMQDLADAFGTGAVAVVKNYGLSLSDVGAALATFGDNNIRGADAGTALRMSVMSLAVPAKTGAKNLKELGFTQQTLANDMAHGGLNTAIKDLVTHMHDAGIVGPKVGQFLTETFGKKAGIGLGLLVGQFDRFESKVDEVTKGAGNFGNAWKTQQQTAKQKLDELDASWHVFLIHIGNDILPALKRILDVLSKHPGIIKAAAGAVAVLAAAWTVSKFASAFSVLGRLTTAILGVGAASTTAATEAAAANLGGAAAGVGGAAGGVAGKAGRSAAAAEGAAAGGAAAGEGGLIARLLGGGVSLGPIAIGIAGIAGGIHEIITDGQVKNLPALDILAKLIAGPGPGSGLKGVGPAEAVGLALNTAKTGNNRGETDLTYLQRVLGSSDAKKYGLSLQGLFKIIQTGTQGDLTGFIASLRSVGFDLKGSPDTIQKVADYLQGLFSRFNSARVAAGDLTKAQKLQMQANYASAVASKYLSTNIADLSKTYHVNGTVAKQLAADNFSLKLETTGTVNAMKGYGVTLDKNTTAGKENINQVAVQSELIKQNAADVFKLTGNQDLANIALRSGATAFEDAAAKAGFNRDQVKGLIDKLLGIPPNPTSNVHVNGIPEAIGALATLEANLRALAQPIIIPILTQNGLLGVASPNYVPNIGDIGAGQGGLNFGGSGPGGIAGGVGHALGGIARGWSLVGEHGPEMIHVGSSSRVLTNRESSAAVGGGGNTYIINALDSRSFQDFLARGGARQIQESISRKTGFGGSSL